MWRDSNLRHCQSVRRSDCRCLSVCLSVCLSFLPALLSVCLSLPVSLSLSISLCLFRFSIYCPLTRLSVCLCQFCLACLSVCLSVRLSFICPFVCLSVCPFVCLSSLCLSGWLAGWLSVTLSFKKKENMLQKCPATITTAYYVGRLNNCTL